MEYHIPTLAKIMQATEKIYKKVNLNNIYLKILERFSDYAASKTPQNEQLGGTGVIYECFKGTL